MCQSDDDGPVGYYGVEGGQGRSGRELVAVARGIGILVAVGLASLLAAWGLEWLSACGSGCTFGDGELRQ